MLRLKTVDQIEIISGLFNLYVWAFYVDFLLTFDPDSRSRLIEPGKRF